MKDFADVLILARNFNFEYQLLKKAVFRTFDRYQEQIPIGIPDCFSEPFSTSYAKQKIWAAFRKKSGADDLPENFAGAVAECAGFLMPLFSPQHPTPLFWTAGRGWETPAGGRECQEVSTEQ